MKTAPEKRMISLIREKKQAVLVYALPALLGARTPVILSPIGFF